MDKQLSLTPPRRLLHRCRRRFSYGAFSYGALRARASLVVSADFDSITAIHRQPVGAGRQPNKFGLAARFCAAVTSVCHPERKRNEVKRNFAEVEVLARERASRAKTEGISKQILMAFLD